MRACAGGILAAVLATASAAFADEPSVAHRHFESGSQAFESNDFERALSEFEAARAAGLTGPAVDYNIGVAAYRLGRYEVAEQAFRRVARTPEMAALAHYNLGLVALRRGESRTAAHYFRMVSRDAADASLRGLATTQLERLDLSEPRAIAARFASFSAGYDDNVALIADADLVEPSGVGDAFLQAQFAMVGPLDRAFRFDAAVFHTNYADLDRYDELTVSAGARYRWVGRSWSHELGGSAAYATLDAEGFERRGTITLQVRRDLAASWSGSARYRLSDVEGLDDFDSLSGTRHHWGLRAERTADRFISRIDYAFERSDLSDPLLSSDRHVLGGELRFQQHRGWELALDASYRQVDYGDDLSGTRSEDQTLIGFEAVRGLGEYWSLFARHEYLINESNDAQFDFDRSRGSLGLAAIW